MSRFLWFTVYIHTLVSKDVLYHAQLQCWTHITTQHNIVPAWNI